MNASTEEADSITRSIVIDTSRDKVWHALSNAEAFGSWFGADLKGQIFAPGARARGQITIPGYEHIYFDVVVDRVEPQDLFSYRWHPYAMDPAVDYGKETPTLVTFTLESTRANGTLLKVVESGFANLPPERRMEALRMNTRGWEGQLNRISRHVA